MEKELKYKLAQLPQYEPPDTVWTGIEARLPLLALPEYDAPDFVWDNIEQAISLSENAPPQLLPRPSNLRILRGGKMGQLAVAASVALLVGMGWWFMNRQTVAPNEVQFSSEIVDNQLIGPISDEDESAFQQVEAFCETAVVVCEQPEFKTLKTELDELNAAREELKIAIGDYNADADLVAELTKIEQERTEVLKHLVEMTMSLNE
jgi:hypothetical protein